MSVVDSTIEKRREYHRAWREANVERRRAYDKQWRENNREKKRDNNKRYSQSEAGKAAIKRSKKNQMLKLAATVGASCLVHCFQCGSVYALEDVVQRGWTLMGRRGCLCDLCQPEGER
jgi:ferric-dicitrate binding protein FerR (iron transport regulator)